MPQEIKKIPIVIASILKPVDDTRMFEKIGCSIVKNRNIELTVIGYPTSRKQFPSSINFYPFIAFRRLSLERIRARYIFLQQVLTIKPQLIIITTHELLFVAWIGKWLTGCRIIYDVQENYYQNILHSGTFPIILKQAVAILVRLKEIVLSTAIDHFFLAEKAYSTELNFIGQRFTILENKTCRSLVGQFSVRNKRQPGRPIQLIFSGTLATSTGVFEAIQWTKQFYQVDATIRLTIIGYCAEPPILSKILADISTCDYIQLIGGDKLVPHQHVLEEISKSDGGFITYLPNTATSGSIPTKLFEYLAFHLPIFLVPHSPWIAYCKPYHAAIMLEKGKSPDELLVELKQGDFYSQPPKKIYWEDQETELLSSITKILR